MAMVCPLPLHVLLVVLLSLSGLFFQVWGHGDTGSTGPPCLRNVGVKLQASYVPGSITVDGLSGDWSSVKGNSFALNPALTDDPKTAYPDGSMQIKVRRLFVFIFVLFLFSLSFRGHLSFLIVWEVLFSGFVSCVSSRWVGDFLFCKTNVI